MCRGVQLHPLPMAVFPHPFSSDLPYFSDRTDFSAQSESKKRAASALRTILLSVSPAGFVLWFSCIQAAANIYLWARLSLHPPRKNTLIFSHSFPLLYLFVITLLFGSICTVRQ
ncbi:hypothetical protein SCLCIDRAFT_699993 [Scleroderma citrinum Foug A]|uniref:Uncharacterized protein n=1 Tax=Scleroderma citrinum Foug A TaxID=1036808 RepID=A0A0C3EMG0_9AGAM|nr:hypothetical protein SCLCIDRAFT_699993 [Scleroderma citrinum Foug A]